MKEEKKRKNMGLKHCKKLQSFNFFMKETSILLLNKTHFKNLGEYLHFINDSQGKSITFSWLHRLLLRERPSVGMSHPSMLFLFFI